MHYSQAEPRSDVAGRVCLSSAIITSWRCSNVCNGDTDRPVITTSGTSDGSEPTEFTTQSHVYCCNSFADGHLLFMTGFSSGD